MSENFFLAFIDELWKTQKIRLFCPTIDPKNKIWKKCKKTHGDIILLHMHTINQDHMIMVPEIWSVTDMIFYQDMGEHGGRFKFCRKIPVKEFIW